MATSKPISANNVDNGGQTILGVDRAIGDQQPSFPVNSAASQFIKGVAASDPWGRRGNDPVNTHWAHSNRMASLPSGWNLDFSIDVGAGLSAVQTVWAADNERTVGGEFTYLYGNAAVNKDYSNLSS